MRQYNDHYFSGIVHFLLIILFDFFRWLKFFIFVSYNWRREFWGVDLLNFLWTVHAKYSLKIENNPKQPASVTVSKIIWKESERNAFKAGRNTDDSQMSSSVLSPDCLFFKTTDKTVKSEILKEWINHSESNIYLRCAMELPGITSKLVRIAKRIMKLTIKNWQQLYRTEGIVSGGLQKLKRWLEEKLRFARGNSKSAKDIPESKKKRTR